MSLTGYILRILNKFTHFSNACISSSFFLITLLSLYFSLSPMKTGKSWGRREFTINMQSSLLSYLDCKETVDFDIFPFCMMVNTLEYLLTFLPILKSL